MAKLDSVSPSRRSVFLLTLAGLVHWAQEETAAQTRKKQAPVGTGKAEPSRTAGKPLPPAVAEMRAAILAAVHAGEIEELRYAIELNELKPEIGAVAGMDPITHLRNISSDGEGRAILAVLGQVLDMGHTTLPVGRDIENNLLYVWPYLAEVPPANLTAAQQVDLLRLVSVEEAKAMRAANRWLWWRLAIGADGTWHGFMKAR